METGRDGSGTMRKVYILDACALIAALSNEEGADKVIEVYKEAAYGETEIMINIINLLEVYYGDYRVHGKEAADIMVNTVKNSPVNIVEKITDDIFKEAGRLKSQYKISLADSISLAQAKISNGILLTADHHELDIVENTESIQFLWIR
jgi:predicted nucleic acid-binding protein